MNNLLNFKNRLLALLGWVVFLLLIEIVLEITCFASFRIPTDSMLPTLCSGDIILVNKSIM